MRAEDKIVSQNEAKQILAGWKKESLKTVFTNGCFDILHLGHVDYLEKSRSLGDRLILGLNTDSSVKRQNKGPERPINNEYSRARILASLFFVDLVVMFEEDTPYDIISDLIPDILVKGDDYSVENIVGADVVIRNGGEVKTIPLVNGYSTTSIINKLKS